MAESPEQVLPPPPSPNHRGSCGRLLLDNLNLPPGTSTYRYQGRDYAESAMHGETRLFEQDDTGARSEYVVFTHVPPEEVICVPRRRRQQQQQKEEENKSQREEEEGPDEEPPSTTTLLKSRNFTYLEDGRILIVRMRTLSHERPKFQFDRLLITKLNNMGLGDKIDGRVGAAVQGTTRTKAPDCSYAPRPLPAGQIRQVAEHCRGDRILRVAEEARVGRQVVAGGIGRRRAAGAGDPHQEEDRDDGDAEVGARAVAHSVRSAAAAAALRAGDHHLQRGSGPARDCPRRSSQPAIREGVSPSSARLGCRFDILRQRVEKLCRRGVD